MRRAVYPGTFDPIHLGHIDIAARSAEIFDELIVAVYDRPGKNVLFSTEDRLAMAREVLKDDDEINSMKSEMKEDIVQALRREPEHAEVLMTLLAVTHRLERIGDHACNIAEDVIYMVEADIVRHQNIE